MLQSCVQRQKSFCVLTILCLVHWTRPNPTVGLRTSRNKLITAILVLHMVIRFQLKKHWENLISHPGRFLSKLKSSSLAEESVQLLVLGVHRCHSFYLHWEYALLVVNPSEQKKSDFKKNKGCKFTWIQLIQVAPCLLQCRKSLKQTKSIVAKNTKGHLSASFSKLNYTGCESYSSCQLD